MRALVRLQSGGRLVCARACVVCCMGTARVGGAQSIHGRSGQVPVALAARSAGAAVVTVLDSSADPQLSGTPNAALSEEPLLSSASLSFAMAVGSMIASF